MKKRLRILFGVFDWGLGHATRNLPLIKELLKRGHEVHILTTGRSLILLKNIFGKKCKYHDVPSVVQLYTNTRHFKTSFALNAAKIVNKLRLARVQTEKIIEKQKYDKVISDCRYDVYDEIDNSYLINHQLKFKGLFGTEWFMERWHANRMKRYKYILVPDFSDKDLSGDLSHNFKYLNKLKVKYIGILSQLKKKNLIKDIDYFISLSGPDIPKAELEDKILSQISSLKGKIVIAGGNPEGGAYKTFGDIKCYSFLNSKQQENMMNRAKFIIIRGGYTSIMELAELGKKALLIPSPGQTEQEYLAGYLRKKKYFFSVPQSHLDLMENIKQAKQYKGFKASWKTDESVNKIINLIGV